jgi:hypothetical protein
MKTCNANKRECSKCGIVWAIILLVIVILAILVFSFFF